MLAESGKPSVSHDHDSRGHAYVRIRGEIDASNLDQLESALNGALEVCPTRLVVDLSEATFIDGAAISRIVLAPRTMLGDDCAVVLRNPSPTVVKVLDVLGMDGLCEIQHDPDGQNSRSYQP